MDFYLPPSLDTASSAEFHVAPAGSGGATAPAPPDPTPRVIDWLSVEAPRADSDWAQAVDQMDEVDLRQLVATLPLIEQAKGVLMGYYGIDAHQAFAILRRWSSVHNIKVRDLATQLVAQVDAHPPDRSTSPGAEPQWSPFRTVQAYLQHNGLG